MHMHAKCDQNIPWGSKVMNILTHWITDRRTNSHSDYSTKIVSEYNQEIPQSQTHGTARKTHTTTTRHREDKLSKATSSLFPIEMIAKLEWTQSNAQQNMEQLQTPTMGVTINKSTTTEPPP